MKLRRVKLADIHCDPANVRKHDEKNLRAIGDSLKSFGQVEPLVVQKSSGRVIGGNGRLEAMRAMGETECDVVEVDVDDVRAAALGIALNRTAELAEWDDDALLSLLSSLPDAERLLTGFGDQEITDILAKVDPDFSPSDSDSQGAIDSKSKVECPECGHTWTP